MPDRAHFISFGFRVFLYLVGGLLVSDALMYYFTDHSLGDSYYDALVVLNIAKHTTLVTTVTVNSVIHISVLVLIFAAALLLSHRISGPMYRFEQVARSVSEGDLTVNVRLREKDYMKEQAEELSAGIKSMRESIGEVDGASGAMRDRLSALERMVSSGGADPDGVNELVKGMKSDVAEIKGALSRFKTD